ncbi:hypothetical protein AZE42_06685 [Rhizopogon vesiculosus]|uniref:Uncharacterized protein n=1 Tax=Rhizopogon vesiculosus TaxID=180088 RepID=A0A1J8QKG3_9AGAM|nr:hypothetical protein AZE42_06685 [Rhizopogon vesiculosus]
MFVGRDDARSSPSHEVSWEVAQSCLNHIGSFYSTRPKPTLEDETQLSSLSSFETAS